jgi:hypothetical protein
MGPLVFMLLMGLVIPLLMVMVMLFISAILECLPLAA